MWEAWGGWRDRGGGWGTGAEALQNGIDAIFRIKDRELPLNDYHTKLITYTANGASVNFGVKSGLLITRLSSTRGWLININCSNNRIELAVKDAFNGSVFGEIDSLYTTLFRLLHTSGKIKSEIKTAAEALNIEHYVLPKLTGTRSIGHRVSALKRLQDMWPAIVTGLQNVEADEKTTAAVRSKVLYH